MERFTRCLWNRSALTVMSAGLFLFAAHAHSNTRTPAAPTNGCPTTGPLNLAVILADFKGAPAGTVNADPAYIRELMNGTSLGFSVADYYQTVSGKRTSFNTVTVLGPYHSTTSFLIHPMENAGAEKGLDAWETHLLNLAQSDFDFSHTDRVVFITPNGIDEQGKPVAIGAGRAAQGACDLDSVNSAGIHHKVGHAWVLAAAGFTGVNRTHDQSMSDAAPIIHELGHTFGLGHANQVNRPQPNFNIPYMNDEILPAENQTLYELSYADPFSAMGSNQVGWFNLPHLAQLGWLEQTQIIEVRSAGTFRIYPLQSPANNLKGLKIPRALIDPGEQTEAFLWVEFRKNFGVYDTEISGIHHDFAGALIHYTNPNQPGPNATWPDETVLLNFHPAHIPVSPYEKDLTLKSAWKDEHSLVNLQVVSVSTDYLDIAVSFQK